MIFKLFPNRFNLLKTFISIFVLLSSTIRLVFLIWSFNETDTSILSLLCTFGIGFLYDLGTISFFAIPYVLYLLIVSKRFYGNWFDRSITYFSYSLGLIIFLFSFFAEITFWEEFKRRFNFIAVDYLVYTYEVTKNINESYPIPLLVAIILLVLFLLLFVTIKRGTFANTFNSDSSFKAKLTPSVIIIIVASIFGLFITNKHAEISENRYNNELSKTGIYAFFSAFRNNELSYTDFYKTIDNDKAFRNVKQGYSNFENKFINSDDNEIFRTITNTDSINKTAKPNVVFICIESLSGKYLNTLGSELNITPNLDALAEESVFFTNIFATGTRTVRGMEAITLSIPPTPGRSIVKRKNNQDLFTISEVFKQQGYNSTFFYGGDGYFDNMNTFFGGNGFDIVDRGRGFLFESNKKTQRKNIKNNEVTFENAWGVCDSDVYNKVLTEADKAHETGEPFFNFIMTTSNHRPYTYPENTIDIPSGTGRKGAIKYTDYAIGEFLKQAKTKPWFKNTVFVIMSDHCASSAGRWALDVKNYHIPALIYNLPNSAPQKVDKLCSQIDIFPTLFSMLNWDYNSNLFGKNIMTMQSEDERAFIGNYRKLGLLKENKLMVLSDQSQANFYTWNREDNSLSNLPLDNRFLEETISYYQVADYLYQSNGLKIKK